MSLPTGQKQYNEVFFNVYNMYVTALPIIMYAVFDKDVLGEPQLPTSLPHSFDPSADVFR
jgi:hypothetical protein